MPISNERRHYLTMPDEAYKKQIEQEASAEDVSMSVYIIRRLDLLSEIERDPVGHALVKAIANVQPE